MIRLACGSLFTEDMGNEEETTISLTSAQQIDYFLWKQKQIQLWGHWDCVQSPPSPRRKCLSCRDSAFLLEQATVWILKQRKVSSLSRYCRLVFLKVWLIWFTLYASQLIDSLANWCRRAASCKFMAAAKLCLRRKAVKKKIKKESRISPNKKKIYISPPAFGQRWRKEQNGGQIDYRMLNTPPTCLHS